MQFDYATSQDADDEIWQHKSNMDTNFIKHYVILEKGGPF